MNPAPATDYRQLTRFFFPLALQAMAQALSHPLVAMVASRGPGGPLNLAGLSQSGMVMFFLGIFAIYYMTTGMVFAKDREGYRTFWRVCMGTGLVIVIIQALLSLPAAAHLLFGQMVGLPPSIERPAQITLLATVPLQLLFFSRIPYQVVLCNNRATGRASMATMGRIALTALLSPLFCNIGLVGPLWAVVCLTIPVILEVGVSRWFARPYIVRMPPAPGPPPRGREIFIFNLPLAVGGIFMVFSMLILSAFIARAPDPERILPIYFLTIGLVNPVSFAATRIQAVVLAFPPADVALEPSPPTAIEAYAHFTGDPSQHPNDPPTLRFAMLAGAVLGLVPLLFILPGLIDFYYVTLQKLKPADLDFVRITALSFIAMPFAVAWRAHREGLAAWYKKPMAVLAGHGVYMVIVIGCGFLALVVGLPGYLIGSGALTLASLVSAFIIRISIEWPQEKMVRVEHAAPPDIQVR